MENENVIKNENAIKINENVSIEENNVKTNENNTIEQKEVIEENAINENVENVTLEQFNTIETTEGTVLLNQAIYMELKTNNLYLNLILVALVLCFLYYVISKALKKLFYINI